ncbi:MAG: hypothetical protein ACKPKO_50800, partial [Candidatus Fonsibacter sp.]
MYDDTYEFIVPRGSRVSDTKDALIIKRFTGWEPNEMTLKKRFLCGLELDDNDVIDENMALTLFLAQTINSDHSTTIRNTSHNKNNQPPSAVPDGDL